MRRARASCHCRRPIDTLDPEREQDDLLPTKRPECEPVPDLNSAWML